MEYDARSRFQNGDVAQVAEFTTVVEFSTVKQWRCRRRGSEENCDDCQQSRQTERKLDKTPLQWESRSVTVAWMQTITGMLYLTLVTTPRLPRQEAGLREGRKECPPMASSS